jgi:hypothetical protein
MLFLRFVILNLVENKTVLIAFEMSDINHSLGQMNKKILGHAGNSFFLILIVEGHLFK